MDEKATNEEIKEHVNKFIILYNKRIDDNLKKIGFKYEYDELINLKHR
ncbi:hypothetical protein FACS1894218_1650 [Bacilli bacterium]|nr:hypothetical protein FACS1894218_1650 [Bacilli bacterium]